MIVRGKNMCNLEIFYDICRKFGENYRVGLFFFDDFLRDIGYFIRFFYVGY